MTDLEDFYNQRLKDLFLKDFSKLKTKELKCIEESTAFSIFKLHKYKKQLLNDCDKTLERANDLLFSIRFLKNH